MGNGSNSAKGGKPPWRKVRRSWLLRRGWHRKLRGQRSAAVRPWKTPVYLGEAALELTYIGMIQAVVGIAIVLAGTPRVAFLFLVLCSLLDGSAAIILPALGGSSIPPVQFALLFVFMRILVPKGGLYGYLPQAVRANAWLLLFCFYGVANAVIGPRLFAGQVTVFPMRPDPAAGLFNLIPLAPTSQNLTAGSYLLGALLLAIASYVFCRARGAADTLIKMAVWGGWFFVVTGLLDLVSRGTPVEDALAVFRNGDYVQLSGDVDGFVRIRGLMPEASTFAGACFTFFVINAELWYRSIRSSPTGLLTTLTGLLLVMSTSSTAYVALAGYSIFFFLRAILLPGALPQGKMVQVAVFGFVVLFFVSIAMVLVPALPEAIYKMIYTMTVDKSNSELGRQRMFWAMLGVKGFLESYGLGIGPGSFRSSSMIMAIIGSMGIIGLASFVMYLLAVFQPLRRSSWGMGADRIQTLGGGIASAAVVSLIPAAVGSPQPSPAATFSILVGAALALRPAVSSNRAGPRSGGAAAPACDETLGEPA